MWPIAFVIGFSARQLLKHLPTCRRRPAVIQLVLASSELTNGGEPWICVNLTVKKGGKKEEDVCCETYFGFLILRVVLSVDVARGGLVRDPERGVTDLRREVVLEVEEARLAHVARLCASLADDRRLVAHARARVPAEHGEWPRARSALSSKLLL